MNVSERLAASAVVPVVVLDDAKDAVATAKALLAGGVDVMEITFRTAAAADSIKAVAEGCPDMLVGAGTVITLEQCKKAVEFGAKFIVSPGFDEEVVRWCVENGVAVTPGCVTPTEIKMCIRDRAVCGCGAGAGAAVLPSSLSIPRSRSCVAPILPRSCACSFANSFGDVYKRQPLPE